MILLRNFPDAAMLINRHVHKQTFSHLAGCLGGAVQCPDFHVDFHGAAADVHQFTVAAHLGAHGRGLHSPRGGPLQLPRVHDNLPWTHLRICCFAEDRRRQEALDICGCCHRFPDRGLITGGLAKEHQTNEKKRTEDAAESREERENLSGNVW